MRSLLCNDGKRLRTSLFVVLLSGLMWAASCLAQQEKPSGDTIAQELTETFNDEQISFNDNLIVLGKEDAPISVMFVFGLSADTTDFVRRFLPSIVRNYVDAGKVKLVIIEFPLTWHDIQAFAGFRCVPASKHWEVLREAVAYPQTAHHLKADSILNAPSHIWPIMKNYGVGRDLAEKCMRNTAIAGHIEAHRQVVTDTWSIKQAPSFVIAGKVITNIFSVEDAIETALKGGQ